MVTCGEPDISKRSSRRGSDTIGVYLERRKHEKVAIARKAIGNPSIFNVYAVREIRGCREQRGKSPAVATLSHEATYNMPPVEVLATGVMREARSDKNEQDGM